MNQKLGILVYLAPPNLVKASAFFQNMKNFPAKHELIIYSDYNYSSSWPMVYKLNAPVEVAKTEKNRLAVNNLVFFTGLRIAANKQFTHVMVLEHDARVNVAGWDEIIWQEFLTKNPEAIAGGTMVVFNPSSFNREAAENFEALISGGKEKRLVPLAVCGTSHLAEQRPSCVFPNGAFAIYRMDWLLRVFPEVIGTPQEYIELSKSSKTWDYEIGLRLWSEFKEKTYRRIVSLNSIYSGYGNILCSEEERKQWLTDGKIVGVHQIKSDWPGPEPKTESQPAVIQPVAEKPKAEIKMRLFVVTYFKDFEYLRYCLLSIKKFATGFVGTTVLVPTKDVPALRNIIKEVGIESVTVKSGYEWKNKGNVWHCCQEFRADEWCPDSDYIAHLDADCIFTAPATPETFFRDGKPLLRYEAFETLVRRHPGTANWKIAVDLCLPFNVEVETMRGHAEVYGRELYAITRQLVEQKTGQLFNEYIHAAKNDYPSTICEYATLGAVAYYKFIDFYYPLDLAKEPNPDKNHYPICQFWSWRSPELPQEINFNGIKENIAPLEIIKRFELTNPSV